MVRGLVFYEKIGFVKFFAGVVLAGLTVLSVAKAEQEHKPFTVADDIALSIFRPNYEVPNPKFSPDGNYFAVCSERGLLDANQVENSLRFYRTQDVTSFLLNAEGREAPSPEWVVKRADKEVDVMTDGVIGKWRWLSDSSGVAFLEKDAEGNHRVFVADLRKKAVEPLTAEAEDVKDFAISDRQHYVYTAPDLAEWKKFAERKQAEQKAPAIVGTGRGIEELLFPDDPYIKRMGAPASHLWAFNGGSRFEVKQDGSPLDPQGGLALSPDGRTLITTLPVPEVPASWETLYPPSFASSQSHIHAGHGTASQFVRIDLSNGSVTSVTGAPVSGAAGWTALGDPSWSSDGEEVLLPGTFVAEPNNKPSRPCVAVVDLRLKKSSCVEVLKGLTQNGHEEGYHLVVNARFVSGDKRGVIVSFWLPPNATTGSAEYRRAADGTWKVAQQKSGEIEVNGEGLAIEIKEGLDAPPMLTASKSGTARVVWDPNPQLKEIALGEASVYTWKDGKGREWQGGLYKPVGYKPGQRYPLVIQTHGFDGSYFFPAGIAFPSGFAARELAGAGIAVLQVEEDCPGVKAETPAEGPCAVDSYEYGAKQLVADGLVDPEKIGIIGFSRSCFYTMEELTKGSMGIKAALISDGVMLGYMDYILSPDRSSGEANAMIGAAPFGEGLQEWFKKSPNFRLDKVNSALMVIAHGRDSLFSMWEPYAALHYLRKPVDLMLLNQSTYEHVLTNPVERMASQGGSVDWFRFWLQGYEDPDPAKAAQYKRWRELRTLQAENGKKTNSAQTSAN